jgi:hypothetical protein
LRTQLPNFTVFKVEAHATFHFLGGFRLSLLQNMKHVFKKLLDFAQFFILNKNRTAENLSFSCFIFVSSVTNRKINSLESPF